VAFANNLRSILTIFREKAVPDLPVYRFARAGGAAET